MRVVPFLISLVVTVALVLALSMQLPAGGSKTPPLGEFLSPQHGCWQNAEPYNQNLHANFSFAELNGKVEVYFDDRLVPHVYADNDQDAYFVQGYLHAKFRLWQMEFQTHAAAGRLSEILGPQSGDRDFVLIDKYFRRLGMVYGAERSLVKMEADPETRNQLNAYTAGVNAFISRLPHNKRPLEYKLLDYSPEPWTNLKSALFLKYMAYDLAGKSDYDFEMTNAKNVFSAMDIEKLYPVFADSVDPIVPKGTVFPPPAVQPVAPATADSIYYAATDSIDPVIKLQPDKDNGSNNWAVSGLKTKSGSPILCNDPHLGLNMPSLWYEMQIQTPSFNAYGATFPGAANIIIGFNDSCAWGVTNAGRDVKDYYEVQFRDTTMQEYWYNGQWTATTFRDEVIKVKGGATITEHIALTVFGPVMYDRKFPNKLQNNKYYALRWKAHDPSNEGYTFYKLNRARNYDDYLQAISTFECPGQNFVFATVGGDIAIRQQGKFPAKWYRQGDFVMPGTDSAYQWQQYIPTNENVLMLNPDRGFVSSANQVPANDAYPYYLGGSFPVYRGIIINRLLHQMDNITPDDMMQLQTDNYNVFAEYARPVLLKYLKDAQFTIEEESFLNALRSWNLRNDVGETGPTVFTLWWDKFEYAILNDEFARSPLPLRWPDESTVLDLVTKDSTLKFADDIRTPGKETLTDMAIVSFKNAVEELKALKAEDKLSWGEYKATGVRHLLGIAALSRNGLPVGGGSHIINATKKDHGPSWRMVVSLTGDIEGFCVYPGGQSGNPGSRYYDTFVDTWVAGRYNKVLFATKREAETGNKMRWTMTFSKA